MPSSHNPVIRMFQCLVIVLKIPLFSMPSSHDSVIHCIDLFAMLYKGCQASTRSTDRVLD
jgi:hypothetical protein